VERENRISRGEIYFVYLDPAFGREIGGYKHRPVVVVSINDIHQGTRIVSIVPGTTTPYQAQNIVKVERTAQNRLQETTFFQCHQLRAIDQGRMTSRSIGRLSDDDFKRIEQAIRHSLGLPEKT
jgi:mRNA-degrading endonuclease toxin of MazEF toxin-antitoxin module